jgi:hypothetical protein
MAHNFIGGWGVYNIIQDHKLYKKNSIQFIFASLNENDRFKILYITASNSQTIFEDIGIVNFSYDKGLV